MLGLAATVGGAAAGNGAVQVAPANYHGWPGALRMDNGVIEVVVVPEVGRLMHLGFRGGENVIWENRALLGHRFDGRQKEWVNLGGDKSWPSPEAEWGRYTGDKSWFPPRAFDGLPATARVENGEIVLTAPVDTHYQVRVVRRFHLAPGRPVLTVRTIYERVEGAPARMGVWIITQLREPDGVFIPVPEPGLFTNGCVALSRTLPPSLKRLANPALLSLVRDRKDSYKIGSDAGTLIWVGPQAVLRIDSPRLPGRDYPDQGSSAEVYTNGGALDYVELEMLGPLQTLAPGDTLTQTNVYTLQRRKAADPAQAARDILRNPAGN